VKPEVGVIPTAYVNQYRRFAATGLTIQPLGGSNDSSLQYFGAELRRPDSDLPDTAVESTSRISRFQVF